MARQYLQDGPYIDPPIASPLSADVGTGAVSMWLGTDFTAVPAYDARAGKIYVVEAGGILTTATTGALTITPGFGASSPGTALGASVAQTVPGTALTAVPWYLRSTWVVRTVGAGGAANGTMIGQGLFHTASVAGTAGAGPIGLTFGGTSCAFDQAARNFFTFQKTLSVAGSFTTHWAAIYTMN